MSFTLVTTTRQYNGFATELEAKEFYTESGMTGLFIIRCEMAMPLAA